MINGGRLYFMAMSRNNLSSFSTRLTLALHVIFLPFCKMNWWWFVKFAVFIGSTWSMVWLISDAAALFTDWQFGRMIIASISACVNPYLFCIYDTVFLELDSIILLAMQSALFFLWEKAPCMLPLSLMHLSISICRPLKTCKSLIPSIYRVFVLICEMVFEGKQLLSTMIFHWPIPNFINACFKILTSYYVHLW